MLKSLVLQNFRGHKNLSIELKSLTVITGINGAGKSSIAEAILTLFTGRNSTSPEGVGLKNCIMTGQEKAIISADYKTVKIIREIPNALAIIKDGEKMKGSLTNLQDMIYQSFDADADGLYTAINSSGFFKRFTGSERKEFLFSVLKIKQTLDAAMDMLDEYVVKKKVPMDILGEVVSYIGAMNPRPTSRDEIHEKAYNDRRVLKQSIEAYPSQIESLQNISESLPEGVTIEDLPAAKEQLGELKTEYQKLKTSSPKLDGDKSLLSSLQVELATAKRQLSDITTGLASASKKQITCPVFKIVCGTKIEDVTAFLSTQKTEIGKKIQKLEKQVQELTAKIKTSENEYAQKIQAIEPRIPKGEKLISALEQFSKVNSAVENIKKKEEADKKKLAVVDLLVDIYGPQGIIIDILKRKVTEFEQIFNKNLTTLAPSYAMKVVVAEKECDFFISGNGLNRYIEDLSTSELLRMEICMHKTLQELFGIGLLIIDNVEILDAANEKLLTTFAKENAKTGQVIVITSYVPIGLRDESVVVIGPMPEDAGSRTQNKEQFVPAVSSSPKPAEPVVPSRSSAKLITEIQAKWPAVIKAVLKDKPGLSSCLSSAQISGFDGTTITLTLAEQFRAEMLTLDIEAWQPTAIKTIGKPVQFKIVSTETLEPSVVIKTNASAEKEKKEQITNSPGVQNVIDLFGGQIMSSSGNETKN